MDPLVQAKKSKKTITLILVLTAFLAVVSVVIGYYYLQIQDLSPQDSNASSGCACYFVSSDTESKSCSTFTPKNAFEFQTGTIQSNGSCSATCDLRTASSLVHQTENIAACKISDFTIAPGCVDISIEDDAKKRYANEVPSDKEVTISAKFQTPSNLASTDSDYFSNFSFIINGEKIEIKASDAKSVGAGVEKSYTISTKVKGFKSADTLNVQAFGTSSTGSEMTSEACNRTVAITKPTAPTCSVLQAEVVNDTLGKPVVNEITMNTASISTVNTLSIKFTVGDSSTVLTTKNLATSMVDGAIVLSKSYLYSATNFTQNKSFSVLDKETGEIEISAELIVNGSAIDSKNCTGKFKIPVFDDGKTPTDGGNTPVEPVNPVDTTTSDFSVSKSASLTCVERVAPSNTLNYTITVKNDDTDSEKVVRIEDKLPLGFTYKAGSTYLNGALSADSGLVNVETVGSTQQITFSTTDGWTITSGDSMTIRFTATVASTALTGANLNEVVVVPANVAADSTSLRTSKSVTVAQSCTSPETGIFDSTVTKILLSIFVILIGTYFYFSQNGIEISQQIVSSGIGKAITKANLRKNNPKKYFEESLIESIDKKRD